jgi:hypothetical protein
MPNVNASMISEHGGHRVLITVDGRTVETPPAEHLVFYAGLAVLAGTGIIHWPVAMALGVGHVLIEVTKRPGLEALGEALAEA